MCGCGCACVFVHGGYAYTYIHTGDGITHNLPSFNTHTNIPGRLRLMVPLTELHSTLSGHVAYEIPHM